MKKVVFLLVFFLLTVANNRLTAADPRPDASQAITVHETFGGAEMPMGEGEEQSGAEEEGKDVVEDEDDAGLDHRLISRERSAYTDLHILYQEQLFKALEKEVVIPPPRA
ncbi:MAG TPA: hypothetical protein VK508_10215 [Cyclobacteriaceae bacterium]|nr:hypothetical protein [Cyclobacteriaceae bacterium]